MTRTAQIEHQTTRWRAHRLSWAVTAWACLVLPSGVFAAQSAAPGNLDPLPVDSVSNQPPLDQATVDLSNVRGKSDRELTELTAQWGQLSAAERRVLLAEVRTRMQLRQRTAQRVPRVTVTRRYGRIVRQPDGSVVVQTQVIRPRSEGNPMVRQQTPQEASQGQVRRHGRVTFGFGFERRGARNTEVPVDESVAAGTQAGESDIGANSAQSSTEPR